VGHHPGLGWDSLVLPESDADGPSIGDNVLTPHSIGRITPTGEITEFPVRRRQEPILPEESQFGFCFPTNIVQGPNDILFFTSSDPGLGRMKRRESAFLNLTGPLLPYTPRSA
jgi:hypothetical protein